MSVKDEIARRDRESVHTKRCVYCDQPAAYVGRGAVSGRRKATCEQHGEVLVPWSRERV